MDAQYHLNIDVPPGIVLEAHEPRLHMILARQKAVWVNAEPAFCDVGVTGPLSLASCTSDHCFERVKPRKRVKNQGQTLTQKGVPFMARKSTGLVCPFPTGLGSTFSVALRIQAHQGPIGTVLSILPAPGAARAVTLSQSQSGFDLDVGDDDSLINVPVKRLDDVHTVLFSVGANMIRCQVNQGKVQHRTVDTQARKNSNAKVYLGADFDAALDAKVQNGFVVQDLMIWPSFDILDPKRKNFPKLTRFVNSYFQEGL